MEPTSRAVGSGCWGTDGVAVWRAAARRQGCGRAGGTGLDALGRGGRGRRPCPCCVGRDWMDAGVRDAGRGDRQCVGVAGRGGGTGGHGVRMVAAAQRGGSGGAGGCGQGVGRGGRRARGRGTAAAAVRQRSRPPGRYRLRPAVAAAVAKRRWRPAGVTGDGRRVLSGAGVGATGGVGRAGCGQDDAGHPGPARPDPGGTRAAGIR